MRANLTQRRKAAKPQRRKCSGPRPQHLRFTPQLQRCTGRRSFFLAAARRDGARSGSDKISLPSVWTPDTSGGNYGAHIWHSAEFRSDNPQRWQFWNQALIQMKLKSQ